MFNTLFSMRIVKDPDTRKQEILLGALKVFARKGYERTTIADIARELGISQGLCYRYYASKEEIHEAALDQYSSQLVSAARNHFEQDNRTLKEKILSFSGSIVDYQKAEAGNELFYGLFHGEANRKMHEALVLKTASKLIPFIQRELRIAQERGEIRISDTQTFSYFLVYGQIGILFNNPDSSAYTKQIQSLLLELLDL